MQHEEGRNADGTASHISPCKSPMAARARQPLEAFERWLLTQPGRRHRPSCINAERARRYCFLVNAVASDTGTQVLRARHAAALEEHTRAWCEQRGRHSAAPLAAAREYVRFLGVGACVRPRTAGHSDSRVPLALRRSLWLREMGPVFVGRCQTPWCSQQIEVFNFHAGHRQARAHGGPTELANLVVLCSACNLSMGTENFTRWAARGGAPGAPQAVAGTVQEEAPA